MKKFFLALLILSFAFTAFASAFADENNAYWNDAVYSAIEQKVMSNVPKFPDKDFNVTDAKYSGLVTDMDEQYFMADPNNKDGHLTKSQTVKDYTGAIQAAIDEASKSGGGRVVIPAGVYYTGSIEIKSNVNLHLSEGCELRFVRNISNKYYPMVLTSFEGNDTYNYAAPVRAFHAKNIALTGKGTLNPQADPYNWQA
ncbi:MAG: hypothetical protein IJT58_02965 [Synergistaceae bacterium]|nr:hypothetical protein [Synergistaceae bacterium]